MAERRLGDSQEKDRSSLTAVSNLSPRPGEP